MDGWMKRWMDGRTDGHMDGCWMGKKIRKIDKKNGLKRLKFNKTRDTTGFVSSKVLTKNVENEPIYQNVPSEPKI